MPPTSKLNQQLVEKARKRWTQPKANKRPREFSNENINDLNRNPVDNVEICNNENNLINNNPSILEDILYDNVIPVKQFCSQGTQTDFKPRNKIVQTNFDISDISSNYNSEICSKINIDIIADVVDVLRDSCSNWNSMQERIFSVILYMLLRNLDFKYDFISSILIVSFNSFI